MRTNRKYNIKAKTSESTGFGSNASYNAGRFVNKDGVANVVKIGSGILERHSIYHTLLEFSRVKFLLSIFGFFIIINIIFAFVYYLIGIEHLGGITYGSPLQNFGEAFFFSAQTFTTVGYGRINPSGFLTSSIAAVEALTGLLSFAVVTGLFYGRFSRPRSFLKFSHNMVLAPFKDKTALMFRMVPYKNNRLTEAEVKLTLAMRTDEDGNPANKFYTLDLDISQINTLSLSWTVVHPIDEKSPLFNLSEEDIRNSDIELLVFVKAFDEVFSNTVIGRTSYNSSEILFGAKFRIMYEASPEGKYTILHLDRLNDTEKATLPVTSNLEIPVST
jgi:hypothetical protein